MIDGLLESAPRRRRSLRGTLPSVLLHAALILLAVRATARAALESAAPTRSPHVVYVAPSTPPTPPTPRHVDDHALAHAPDPHRVTLPRTPDVPIPTANVPTELPPIGRTLTRPNDFGNGIAPTVPTAGTGTVAPTGVFVAGTVDREVVPLPGNATPQYPEQLRSSGIQGTVVAQFVVDTLGRVEPGSFRVLTSDNPAFARAVEQVIPKLRFRPAEAGGHKVRQLVQQPFSFVLR